MKRFVRTGGLRLAAAALATTALIGPALAEVETVVVTAERRTVDLQKTPLAATVLSGDDLQKRNVTTVDQLMFVTPSLTVNNFGQGNDFNIRGLGKGESNIQTPSGVVTYRDGVPVIGGFVQNEPYYDISDIQVLRGPQGTFGGTNATGGVVFINEKNPDLTGGYGGYVQVQAGNYSDGALQGALNVPVSDTFALRIAADGESRESFWTITPGPGFSGDPGRLDRADARLSFLWMPAPALEVLFKTDYNFFNFGGYPADPASNTTDPFHISNNAHNAAQDYNWRNVLSVKYSFDDGISLRSLTSYQQARAAETIDLDGTSAAPLTFQDVGLIKTWTQELDLVSPDNQPFTWILGGFFQREIDELPPRPGNTQFDIGVPSGFIDIVLTYRTPKQHEAVFGQVSYNITDNLQLQVGARYNHSTFDLVDHGQTLLFGFPIAENEVPCVGPTPSCPVTRTGHQADGKLTGKVALNWTVSEDDFLYAFFATGHKDGGQNTNANQPADILPEDVRNAEVGWKSTLGDGHIRTQLDGFWNDYSRFQVSLYDPTTNTSPILNAPSAKIWGFEAQAQAVWDEFSFDMSAAYLHSRFGGFFAVNGTGTPGLTCDLHSGGTDPLCTDLTGEPLVYAPTWTFNAGAQYVFAVGGDYKLTPRVDYAYVGPQWTSVFHAPPVHLGDRNLLNAQLSLTEDNWDLTGYVTNLTNLHYVAAANVSLRYAGAPRQFGLRLSKSF